jgi:hypothetical protein
LRLGLVDAELPEYLVNVGTGLDVEVHKQLHYSVVGAHGVHVNHIVHAVHLLLDGCGDGLRESLGVSAGISGGHQNLRRNDIGKL